MARFTIFGATGFIGRSLAGRLRAGGHEVLGLSRGDQPSRGAHLGHAIYCIGLTANFRTNLTDTARAHVSVLCDALDSYSYDSFLYLSSTRVYMGSKSTHEDTSLTVRPASVDYVYNLSKLTGEALCLARSSPEFRVARIANVVGPGDSSVNFLPSLLEDACRAGRLTVRTSPQSAKDYVDINDVSLVLEEIALRGTCRVYNVASGVNVSNEQIASLIRDRVPAAVEFAPDAAANTFPAIDIGRITSEFHFRPTSFEESFDRMLNGLRVGEGT